MEVHEVLRLGPRGDVRGDDLSHREPQAPDERAEAEHQKSQPAVVPAVLPQLPKRTSTGERQRTVHAVVLQIVSREPDPREHAHEAHRREEVLEGVVLPADEGVELLGEGERPLALAVLLEKPERVLVGVDRGAPRLRRVVRHGDRSDRATRPYARDDGDAFSDPGSAGIRARRGLRGDRASLVYARRLRVFSTGEGSRARALVSMRYVAARCGNPADSARGSPSQESNTLNTPPTRKGDKRVKSRSTRANTRSDRLVHPQRPHNSTINPITPNPESPDRPEQEPRFFWPTTAMKFEAIFLRIGARLKGSSDRFLLKSLSNDIGRHTVF